MKRLSMLLVALVAGCASVEEPKLEEPKSKASAEGAAPKAEAKVYKDYKAAMQAIWALRGKDKDAAAAAADQAVALAKTPDEKSEALFRKGDLYWNSRGDVRQGKFGLEALQVEGISARRRAASVSDLVKKYYPAKGKEGFADAEKLVAETLARADFTDAFAIVQVTTAIAGLEFDNFQVEKAEKRLAGLEKVKGVNLFDVIRARADLAVRKGDLAEGIRQFERRSLALIVDGNLLIQFSQQLGPTVEVPVEIQLRHQKRQPLVVLELIGRVRVLVALLGDLLPVADDPQVVRGQFVLGAFRVIAQIEQRVHDGMVEAGMSVLVVEALQGRCLEHRGDVLKAGLVEDSERPPRQHEHPMELGDRDGGFEFPGHYLTSSNILSRNSFSSCLIFRTFTSSLPSSVTFATP